MAPVSRADQSGHAVRPDIDAPNASIDELAQGRDPQPLAAREALADAIQRSKADDMTQPATPLSDA